VDLVKFSAADRRLPMRRPSASADRRGRAAVRAGDVTAAPGPETASVHRAAQTVDLPSIGIQFTVDELYSAAGVP
jgi:hypothetical protein